ncbi:unannotated protein [freshwater metagenome]|uniref:Unannotated protein n=1 Tax=freshwater metagenome TaxID=449393 RepID=A0A6J7MAY7_9ZZZZ
MPTFRTVSIIPGIENLAPLLTETSNGLSGLPNAFPVDFSKSFSALAISL